MLKYFIERAACLILFIAAICGGTAVSKAETDGSKHLKIGAVLSLSGIAANNGEAIRKGMILAFEDLKASGWTVDVNFQDDGTNPKKTLSAIQFLISRDYRIFVGPTWSFLTNVAMPVLEKAGALAIVPAGSSDINGGASKAIFNLCPKRSGELSVINEWLKPRSYKKAFILTPLGDWGVIHREVFRQSVEQSGITVVGDEQFDYELEPGALKTILLRAKANGADLFLTTAGGSDLANILKFKANLQWPAAMLTTEDLWDSIDEGLISSENLVLKDAWIVGLPLNAEFNKKFQARFNESPKMYADRAYDAVMLIAKGMQARDGSPIALRSFVSKGTPFRGVTGEIRFNALGDRMAEEYSVMSAFNNKDRM